MSNLMLSAKRAAPTRRAVNPARPRQAFTAAAYLAPTLVALLLINIFPILYTFYISLTNRNGPARFSEGNYQITGLQNYARLLGQADFYLVFGRTLLYAVVCVFLFFVVGLLFALILNNPAIKGQAVWRSLLMLGWAARYWTTALVWNCIC